MKKILLATVIYPTSYFELFLKDIILSMRNQSYQDFSVLFFLDKVSSTLVKPIIEAYDLSQKNIFYLQNTSNLTPSAIRQNIIDFSYENKYDMLFFCDFDEILFPQKIEKTILYMQDRFDFSFCNTLLTDSLLAPINGEGFLDKKKIPSIVQTIFPILEKNFIGLGDLAINLKKKDLYKLSAKTYAYDWFIATHMLLNRWKGIKIEECLGSYRQHDLNYVGGNFKLTTQNLSLGIKVKKQHYKYFCVFNNIFKSLLDEILKTECYVLKNREKYIKIINDNFSTEKMCWWENIKTLEEIKPWI